MLSFEKILSGGDLRSIGDSNAIVSQIQNQNDFDELFKCLFHKDRIVVMRTADIIEKITIHQPLYLQNHKNELIELSKLASDKELIWHLALIIPRLQLDDKEFNTVWDILIRWTMDKKSSRIVRANSIQGLDIMKEQKRALEKNFCSILLELEKENISSINARIRKLRKHSNCKK